MSAEGGPYIVRHLSPLEVIEGHPKVWRRELSVKAVVDLDILKSDLIDQFAWDESIPDTGPITYLDLRRWVFDLGPEGGKVELPDGSVVEVEATDWAELREQTTGLDRDGFTLDTDTLAAWNAEHGVGGGC